MYIYIIIFFCFGLYGLFGKVNQNEKKKKMYLFITFGIMTLISSLRDENVGIDLGEIYKPIFYEISKHNWSELGRINIEFGYAVFNKILLIFTKNFQIYTLITSIFINYTYARFIYKNSKDVAISTSLYLLLDVFFMGMNIIRQEIAICILLYSYDYIMNRENKKAILLTFLAISFHASAIIWLIGFFIDKIKVNKNRFLFLFLIMLILILSLDWILPIISDIIYNIGLTNNKNYNFYLNGSVFGQGRVNLNSFVNIFIAFMFYVLTYYYLFYVNKKNDRKYNFWFYSILLYLFFNICILKIYVLSRFIYYFLPFVLIVAAEIFYEIKNRDNQKILFFSIYTLLIARYLYVCVNLAGNLYGVVPYIMFF